MNRLHKLVGVERSLTEVSSALHSWVRERHAPIVGAVHVTCADETEGECQRAFQHGFVRYLLPQLKFSEQAPLRIANLGGQYEWSAVRIAEQHFADAGRDAKLMVVKLNAHVAVIDGPDGPRYGTLERYAGDDSACCGALAGMLGGARLPFAERLLELFGSEGLDRREILLDEARVEPRIRPLLAAVASARLHARKVIVDVQDYRPTTPTRWVVMPCVTVNRPDRDTEIVCGVYLTEDPADSSTASYYGLGDDPAGYRYSIVHGRCEIADDHLGTERAARDHRRVARERMPDAIPARDPRIEKVAQEVAAKRHLQHGHSTELLLRLVAVLVDVAPIPAAILLFGHGVTSIHHAFRVHRISRDLDSSDEARHVLDDVRARVDQLEPEQRAAMIELLTRQYR